MEREQFVIASTAARTIAVSMRAVTEIGEQGAVLAGVKPS